MALGEEREKQRINRVLVLGILLHGRESDGLRSRLVAVFLQQLFVLGFHIYLVTDQLTRFYRGRSRFLKSTTSHVVHIVCRVCAVRYAAVTFKMVRPSWLRDSFNSHGDGWDNFITRSYLSARCYLYRSNVNDQRTSISCNESGWYVH